MTARIAVPMASDKLFASTSPGPFGNPASQRPNTGGSAPEKLSHGERGANLWSAVLPKVCSAVDCRRQRAESVDGNEAAASSAMYASSWKSLPGAVRLSTACHGCKLIMFPDAT